MESLRSRHPDELAIVDVCVVDGGDPRATTLVGGAEHHVEVGVDDRLRGRHRIGLSSHRRNLRARWCTCPATPATRPPPATGPTLRRTFGGWELGRFIYPRARACARENSSCFSSSSLRTHLSGGFVGAGEGRSLGPLRGRGVLPQRGRTTPDQAAARKPPCRPRARPLSGKLIRTSVPPPREAARDERRASRSMNFNP